MRLRFSRLVAGALALALASVATAQEYVVVVHPSNPAKDVSMTTLRHIFKAEQQSWSDKSLGDIYLAMPSSKSPEYAFLLDKVYSMSDRELAKHWVEMVYRNKIAARPKELPSNAIILRIVQAKKGAIAILPAAEVAKDAKVKVLTVDGKGAGDKGYALVASKHSMAMASGREDGLGTVQPQPAGYQDDDRLTAVENELLDLQVQLATGDDGGDVSNGPLLDISGFGHVQASSNDVDGTTSNPFALGGLDLFITSNLGDGFSFLNETVFEPTEEGEYVLDVERVIAKYQVNDQFNVQAGRFHTTIGAWNERYHHGEWLQTSIGRPAVLNFEDEGGLLPVHLIGLLVKGQRPIGDSVLDYTLEIGNGRGPTPDPPQIVVDANKSKAVNVQVGYSPASVDGLRVGGGIYTDSIPANADASAGSVHEDLDEIIYSAFATYFGSDWQVMAEYMAINHDGTTQGSTDSDGFYIQVAHPMGEWTPYVRFDSVSLDDADTYFSSLDDRDTIALGTRWDVGQWTALKFQYQTTDIDLAGGGTSDEDAFLVQWSFAF